MQHQEPDLGNGCECYSMRDEACGDITCRQAVGAWLAQLSDSMKREYILAPPIR